MAASPPDFMSRDPDALVAVFEHFGNVDAPSVGSQLYAELSLGISRDRDLLRLAAETRPNQPPPNMLFAAVQYLLLGGTDHELRDHYPILVGDVVAEGGASAAFRDFCLTHRDSIVSLLKTRRTQTCVLQRCVCLLPAFARIIAEAPLPLATLEIGPSAGLNLLWDSYGYDYGHGLHWGDPESKVLLETVRRGDRPLPALPDAIPVAWRVGVDLNPVDIGDDDEVRWIRALIFPEHVERHGRLRAAIRIARGRRPRLVRGDAVDLAAGLLAEAPSGTTLVAFATHALAQIPREGIVGLLKSMQRHGESRPLFFISMEGTGPGHSELFLTRYAGGERETIRLANCNPHGHWLEWLDGLD